jgi:hypothetical protein
MSCKFRLVRRIPENLRRKLARLYTLSEYAHSARMSTRGGVGEVCLRTLFTKINYFDMLKINGLGFRLSSEQGGFMKKHFFFGAIFFLFISFPVNAQNTDKQAETEANELNSDIVITATVQAKELKIEIVPTPKVEFTGNKDRQTVWEADRENLPAEVQPGVTYRDIGIRLRIYSRFSEIQRIVLEAIDETNPPANNPLNPANTTSQPINNQTNETVKPPKQ